MKDGTYIICPRALGVMMIKNKDERIREWDKLTICPNCGCTEQDEDGDCIKCGFDFYIPEECMY